MFSCWEDTRIDLFPLFAQFVPTPLILDFFFLSCFVSQTVQLYRQIILSRLYTLFIVRREKHLEARENILAFERRRKTNQKEYLKIIRATKRLFLYRTRLTSFCVVFTFWRNQRQSERFRAIKKLVCAFHPRSGISVFCLPKGP